MQETQTRSLLSGLDTELVNQILQHSACLTFESDIQLMDIGAYVKSVPLVLSGMVRVSRREEEKELLLYNVKPGELCIMSFTACCNQTTSLIIATTVEPTELLLLPSDSLRNWVKEFGSLNYFIFSQFNSRYVDLIDTINHLLYNRLDERLVAYLREKAVRADFQALALTHQQIANDLGTAREVISRLMKKLEKDGKILQGRNSVIYKE